MGGLVGSAACVLSPSLGGAMNMMGAIPGAAGMQKTILQKVLDETEAKFNTSVPGYLKACMPCHGGSAVETLKRFECAVPADQKDDFQKAYAKYSEAKTKLAEMK